MDAVSMLATEGMSLTLLCKRTLKRTEMQHQDFMMVLLHDQAYSIQGDPGAILSQSLKFLLLGARLLLLRKTNEAERVRFPKSAWKPRAIC